MERLEEGTVEKVGDDDQSIRLLVIKCVMYII